MPIQFIATVPTYQDDRATQLVWESLEEALGDAEGICYYRHPILRVAARSEPELTVLARGFEPLAIRCLSVGLDEIDLITEETWRIGEDNVDSPILELEDYVYGLQHRFDRERDLRRKLSARAALAMPLISRQDFEERFGGDVLPEALGVMWSDRSVGALLTSAAELSDEDWRLARSTFQGINTLNRRRGVVAESAAEMGRAIEILEREIALLDEEQHKVATQIAPGPQRIRGLAGTGKTVVLAMKAANIHLRYPQAQILFTFHTQSLYNQARALITKFFRINSEHDPDWDRLHVRHGWGGSYRPGVYSEACHRVGVPSLSFRDARNLAPAAPFAACCRHALKLDIEPFYDYVLVDEAQDFPVEFFRLLLAISRSDRICWAYDELQSLSSVDVPSAEALFGEDEDGNPRISLAGDDYPGGIEKDFVLHRSYRCPLDVLMLAHGIGLGIHAPRGCVQMLANRQSWTSIGYVVEEGPFRPGEQVTVCRPPENSPNRIAEIYTGEEDLVSLKRFDSREDELTWVAESVARDIHEEGVRPEHIVVVSLNSKRARDYLGTVQRVLLEREVQSTIPGLVADSAEFAEPGQVTLATVYRAKGNEAPVIYLLAFEYLYGYVEEIEVRNRAFTAISRAKGWLRISGAGPRMALAEDEVNALLRDLPCLRFTFPDMGRIRRLDASETSRRRKELRAASESLKRLTKIDREAIAELDPDLRRQVQRMLENLDDDH
jgi:superfamily I DNA and RNA helicase